MAGKGKKRAAPDKGLGKARGKRYFKIVHGGKVASCTIEGCTRVLKLQGSAACPKGYRPAGLVARACGRHFGATGPGDASAGCPVHSSDVGAGGAVVFGSRAHHHGKPSQDEGRKCRVPDVPARLLGSGGTLY